MICLSQSDEEIRKFVSGGGLLRDEDDLVEACCRVGKGFCSGPRHVCDMMAQSLLCALLSGGTEGAREQFQHSLISPSGDDDRQGEVADIGDYLQSSMRMGMASCPVSAHIVESAYPSEHWVPVPQVL